MTSFSEIGSGSSETFSADRGPVVRTSGESDTLRKKMHVHSYNDATWQVVGYIIAIRYDCIQVNVGYFDNAL